MAWFIQQRHERLGRTRVKVKRRPAVGRPRRNGRTKPVAWRWEQRPELGLVQARTKSEARSCFKQASNEKRLPVGTTIAQVAE